MKKKIIKFKPIFLLMLIIAISTTFFPYRAYAGGSIKKYILEEGGDKVTDFVIEEIATQTGYRIASQAEIDAMRASFKKTFPPIQLTPDSESLDEANKRLTKYGFPEMPTTEAVTVQITQDMRKWINDVIETFKTQDTTPKTGEKRLNEKTFTKGITVTYDDADGKTVSKVIPINFPDSYISVWTESVTKDTSDTKNPYFYYTSIVYDITGFDGTDWTTPLDIFTKSSYKAMPVLDYTIDGTTYKNEDDKYKDFLPYPTTGAELDSTTKVPTEITLPVTPNADGTHTIEIPDTTFPTEKTPVADAIQVGPGTMFYTAPTTNPKTGEITDPTTDPKVDIDPKTGFPTPEVPTGDIPKLNFKPLMFATLKFPFCVPWDLWSCFKVFGGSGTPFFYNFDAIIINGSITGGQDFVVIPQFKLDFSDYPIIDDGVKVFKYLELMLFMVFMILKTRNLIRG